MVRIQEEGSLISPWSLMACLLLQAPAAVLTEEGLLWHQLTERTLWLRRLARDFGARLNWPGGYERMDGFYIFIALVTFVFFKIQM